MDNHEKNKTILGPNRQPFPDFSSASDMRNQLNQVAPEYGFIVAEHPEGGFVVQASRTPEKSITSTSPSNPTSAYASINQSSSAYSSSDGTSTANPSMSFHSSNSYTPPQVPTQKEEPKDKLSEEAKKFFSKTPITIRPAWRNFYVQLPLTITGFILAFMSKFIMDAYLPKDMMQWIHQKMPYFDDLIFWSIVIISLYYFLIMAYHRYSNTYTVTKEGVKEREGILARDARTIKFKDIRSVALEQSVFERLLGIGTLEFYTAGYEGADVVFERIANPLKIRDILDEYINASHYKAD